MPPPGQPRSPTGIKALVARHLSFLDRLKPGWFVLALGLWALLLKPLLMATSFGIESLLVPEAVSPLIAVRPLEWLAASLAGGLSGLLGKGLASLIGNMVFLAVGLSLLATATAQFLPLHVFRDRIASPWVRVVISLAVMGLLYTLAFGRIGFFASGVGLGLPLVWAFETQLSKGSANRAFLTTWGIHAFANAAVVILLLVLGGL